MLIYDILPNVKSIFFIIHLKENSKYITSQPAAFDHPSLHRPPSLLLHRELLGSPDLTMAFGFCVLPQDLRWPNLATPMEKFLRTQLVICHVLDSGLKP